MCLVREVEELQGSADSNCAYVQKNRPIFLNTPLVTFKAPSEPTAHTIASLTLITSAHPSIHSPSGLGSLVFYDIIRNIYFVLDSLDIVGDTEQVYLLGQRQERGRDLQIRTTGMCRKTVQLV